MPQTSTDQQGRRGGRTPRDIPTSAYLASKLAQASAFLDRRSQRGRRGQRGQGDQGGFETFGAFGQSSSRRMQPWAIPVAQRPQLAIGKGDTSQLFGYLPELRFAGVAMVRFLSMHQVHSDPSTAYTQELAGAELSTLLCQICPTPASVANARARRKDMQQSVQQPVNAKGRYTLELSYWEQIYLLHVQRIPSGHSIQELASQLFQVAEGLKQAESDERQAKTRIMLADTLLQLRDFPGANQQIVQAIAIIGATHKDPLLAEIAKSADPELAQQAASTVHSSTRQPVGSGSSSRRPSDQ